MLGSTVSYTYGYWFTVDAGGSGGCNRGADETLAYIDCHLPLRAQAVTVHNGLLRVDAIFFDIGSAAMGFPQEQCQGQVALPEDAEASTVRLRLLQFHCKMQRAESVE